LEILGLSFAKIFDCVFYALKNDMKLADLKLEEGDKLVIIAKTVGCQESRLKEENTK